LRDALHSESRKALLTVGGSLPIRIHSNERLPDPTTEIEIQQQTKYPRRIALWWGEPDMYHRLGLPMNGEKVNKWEFDELIKTCTPATFG